MMMPNSITRLVEDSRKASEGTIPAPLLNKERVVANAEKEQELEIKPNRVPSNTLFVPVSPMLRRIRWRLTNTCIMLDMR